MVKRLIIDDVRTFIADSPDDETVHVSTLTDAASQLADSEWDEVWFDFDMGPDEDMAGFARDIIQDNIKVAGIGRAIVHSMSPVGRMYLEATLSNKYNVTMLPVSLLTRFFDAY